MEEHQNEAQQKTIILHYDKRRYDGGSEIEVIEHLEAARHVSLQEAGRKALTESLAEQGENIQNDVNSAESVLQKQENKPCRSKRVMELLVMGPFEISVGFVGVLTTGLAIYTFNQVRNQQMVDHSKDVFRDCVKTLGQGLLHSLAGPFKALKIAVVGI